LEKVSAAQRESLARDWKPFSTLVCVPRTEADYQRLVALLDEVTDEVGEDENHPLASFMDVLGTLVEDYEADSVPELV
jgi:HTH-type transcriptional regulator / antitoxin HigA